MQDKIFLDTNIILYAISTKDEIKHAIAKPIVLSDATISSQVINEASSNCLKKLKFTEDMIEKFIDSSYNRYKVVEFSHKLFLKASSLRLKYNFSYYDSAIVAAALISNSTILYSEDMQHNLVVDDRLTIINPFSES